MRSPSASKPIELEVGRIRALSKGGRHGEALAAAEMLATAAPPSRDVLYLIAANQRCLNRIHEALATLQHLEQQHPRFSLLYQERGYCYTTLRDAPRAIEAFLRGVDINPALATSWSMLERLYRLTGDERNAATAAERVSALKHLPPEVVRAGRLFSDGELSVAGNILRRYLLRSGDDVEALRLLARIQHQRGEPDEAELLLEAALTLAPNYLAARLDHVRVLIDEQKYLRARQEIDTLMRLEPGNSYYLSLYATACVGLGEHEPAIELYRQLLAGSPSAADLHVSLGHALQTVGRRKEATESYQMAGRVRPSFGDAWWSLANLKTYRFSESEIAQMRTEEAAPATGRTTCRSLSSVLRARQGFRGPEGVCGIMAILRARQRTQARRSPIPSGNHRNEHAQADRGVHRAVLRRARECRRAGPRSDFSCWAATLWINAH
jgi:tetratricopeptide (TPR) repeat protein